jgi:two-component system sensor histidine kinase PilS (NtrC family)
MPNLTATRTGPDATVRRESYPSWRALTWFALFHLCLALGLNLAQLPPFGALWRSTPADSLAGWVCIAYLFLVLVGLLLTRLRRPTKEDQIQSAVFVDVVAFTLLMQASGGVASGFGLLLAIAVAAGALLMEGRLALLFAAFATLGVMAQETYTQLYVRSAPESFTRAGLLGVTYFTVAILAHVLYRRIQETEQVAAQRKVDIADLSKLNAFIIQSMGTGVVVVDGERNLRVINGAARELLGCAAADDDRPLGEIAPELAAWLRRHAADSARREDTLRINDRSIALELHLLGEHRTSGALVFLRDRQQLMRKAQELKLASLGRLTAGIAHNIRNPLSAVRHAGELLAESPSLADEDRHLTRIIHRNTARIDETVESVLQLSRRHQAKAEHIDLGAWTQELCAELRETRGLPAERVALEIEADPPTVVADSRHLRQILWNLCDNALIHAGTPERPAHLRLRVGTDPATGRPFLDVCDDGRGIDTETAAEIFTPFFTTSISGTGLGLFIARELSEANGIDLDHVAPPEGGSCFRLVLSVRE